MEKYKTLNQTFIILDPQERIDLTIILEACEIFVTTVGCPSNWNVQDKGIFTGMIRLNGPLGYQCPLLPDSKPSLGIDPTTQQYQQLNIAIGKIMAGFGAQPNISKVSHSKVKTFLTKNQMTARMGQRRKELESWVRNNLVALQTIQENDPSLLPNICYKPSCAKDYETYKTITNIITPPPPPTPPNDLFVF